jgi:ribosomal-protein-alanine N-acetyltransferase
LPEPTSSPPWKLAQLAAKDAESLARLHARCFDKPWSANDFRRFATWPPYFGLTAWRAGEPIGIIVVSMAGTDSDILSFCVDPAFRRHGVASALIRRLLFDIARLGVETLFLEVGIGNAAAVALYRGHGFEDCGRRPGYYDTPAGPQDALVMRLSLAIPADGDASGPNPTHSC